MQKANRRAIILDTSALVAGYDPFSIGEEQYTVPSVKEEMTRNSIGSFRFKMAEENGKLKIQMPDETFLNKVKESATNVGDAFFLSKTDIQILALALQLKTREYSPLIATDDYSIQNVAKYLNIDFASLATFGIRRRLQWIRYCPACRKKYSADYDSKTCEVCGTRLKRKPLRKPQPEKLSR